MCELPKRSVSVISSEKFYPWQKLVLKKYLQASISTKWNIKSFTFITWVDGFVFVLEEVSVSFVNNYENMYTALRVKILNEMFKLNAYLYLFVDRNNINTSFSLYIMLENNLVI